jgi:demethylmenaquinone methyltransferase/2-methoxy-6-polyprenyl-1,4-benzoquinol methylase
MSAALDGALRLVSAPAPDRERSLKSYGAMAEDYHVRTASGMHFRREAVARLAPRPRDVVLDVGCGTGLNFKALREAIGPHGTLIGIELSPKMLDVARRRVEQHGWTNVHLVQSDVAEAEVPAAADAALLCAVHDVMRSPAALRNVLAHLRGGARVVAGGPKWASWKRTDGVSMNLKTWRMNRACVTTFEGFQRPWSHLEDLVDDVVVDDVFNGGGYLASGVRPLTR